MEQVQDMRRYTSADMAKVYCEKCNGCGDCCHGMTDTIYLDPWDVHQLTIALGKNCEELRAAGIVGLHVQEGMILPYLQMKEDGKGACPQLSEDGRCTIHPHRPGYCRLFPLGRDYDADTQTFRYFIVDNGCDMPGKMKVKISKWLGISDLSRYESFVAQWHYFCKDVKRYLAGCEDESFAQQLNLFLLKVFYLTPYVIPEDGSRDFYDLFALRLRQAKGVIEQ